MKSNPSPRSYGTKLLESKDGHDKIESPVTTRKCDIELLNRTGEVKYIDEEGEIMPSIDQIANSKKMRAKITTTEQFEAIGSSREVAKKFKVSTETAHSHMRSLRAKKAREEKEVDKKAVNKVNSEPLNVDASEAVNLNVSKENDQLPENLCAGSLNNVTCCECGELIVDYSEHTKLCASCNAELDKIVKANEAQWSVGVEKVRSIEEIRKSIETDVAILHRMTIAQAEKDFQAWLAGVIEEC